MIAICEAGANRDRLLGAFQRRRVDVGAQRLRHALPDQEQRIGHANRNEDVQRAARDIDPEIAHRAHRVPCEAANQRHREHDAGRRGQIVLMRQTEHLHEVGHRAFAAVVLPIGVGDEADRGVERQIRGDGRLLGRIERKSRLHAHQHIKNEKAANVEQQHGDRIGDRVLLIALVDAGDLVDRDLDRPQDRRQKGALAVEDPGYIGAERWHDGDEDRAIKQNLDPADDGHGRDSFIRTARA